MVWGVVPGVIMINGKDQVAGADLFYWFAGAVGHEDGGSGDEADFSVFRRVTEIIITDCAAVVNSGYGGCVKACQA